MANGPLKIHMVVGFSPAVFNSAVWIFRVGGELVKVGYGSCKPIR